MRLSVIVANSNNSIYIGLEIFAGGKLTSWSKFHNQGDVNSRIEWPNGVYSHLLTKRNVCHVPEL